jgi:hypothetical protein
MTELANTAESSAQSEPLKGLQFSAGLLVALGCLWGIYAVFFAAILTVTGVRVLKADVNTSSSPRSLATSLAVVVVMIALTWLCMTAAAALRSARRWGAYVAMAFGSLLLLFTGTLVYDICHPNRMGPDEGFLILIIPFTLAIGLWWCIYLNLPHVRVRLKS